MDTRRPNNVNDPVGYSPTTHKAGGASLLNRISWGAIFAGVLISIVTLLVLNLLGIGIGLSSINPVQEQSPFSGLGTGAIIWWVISNLIAIFAGGYVAGRLAGLPLASAGILHGILSWCLFTLITFWLLTTTVGSIISGVGTIVSKTLSAAGSGVEALVSDNQSNNSQNQQSSISINQITREVKQILRDTGDPALQPDSLKEAAQNVAQNARQEARSEQRLSDQDINAIVQQVISRGDKLLNNINREDVVNVLAERTDLDEETINKAADAITRNLQQARQELQQEAAQAKQEAEQAGKQVAEATSSAAIWAFVALVLGAIVAAIGGKVGQPHGVPAAEETTT